MDDPTDAAPNDQHIVELIFDGNKQGIELLLQKYGARIEYLFNQQFSPILTEDDVTEVMAFAGMKAFRSAHTFDDAKGTLGGWFYSIAHNTAIDFIREAGDLAQQSIPLEYDPAIDARVPADLEEEPSPEQAKAIAAVEDAITLLPKMQQDIKRADLAAGERADDQWLAAKLGSTVNSIRVQRCEAHKTLAQILKAKATRPVAKVGISK